MDNNLPEPNNITPQMLEERLHLMQTLEGRTPEECRAIADVTLEHYAPRAATLGMRALKNELQELSMRYGYPDDYHRLKTMLRDAEANCNNIFQAFRFPICAILETLGIEYRFLYRMKSVYSIWRKMQRKGKTFDEVYDLFATRIVYKTPDTLQPLTAVIPGYHLQQPQPAPAPTFDPEVLTCWRIYATITAIYPIQPDRIKDWVTHPKPNGYQALHITCKGPGGNWIEVQIRSERMNYEAEYGTVAHWKYKAGNK